MFLFWHFTLRSSKPAGSSPPLHIGGLGNALGLLLLIYCGEPRTLKSKISLIMFVVELLPVRGEEGTGEFRCETSFFG